MLPDATRLGRTALRVADRPSVTEFYRQVVGLDVLTRDGERATLGVDGTPLLVLDGDEDAPPRGRTEAGLYHNAFRVPSRGALGDALGRVRDRWRLGGASDHGTSEALYLSDPEGNGVEIYRDLPRGRWPFADDGLPEFDSERLDLDALDADAAGESTAPPGTDLGHVHLEVTSLEAFRAFYVDALGFDVTRDASSAAFVSAGGYHHHVGANTWNGRSAPVRTGGRGVEWFEVIVPDADALSAVRSRADAHDRPVADTDDGVELADPDGIRVRLRAER